MRGAIVLSLAVCVGGCRPGSVATADPKPLQVSPARLDLGAVALTFSTRGSVTVANPNLFAVDLACVARGPFSLATPPAHVEGGATLALTVSFAPTDEGVADGTLTVNGFDVALTASGFDPHCRSSACEKSVYDPVQATCVTTLAADGSDCSGSLSCLSTATCRSGQCVGSVINCDDGNPCTLDVCGSTGCGHVDALPYCPEPADPCQVPSCDPAKGCGATAAPDGTSCGTRDCTTAQVCIAGACTTRLVPQNQSCLDVVAGVPAGRGYADGPSAIARFGLGGPSVFDSIGNLYLIDGCAIRKVTPGGRVTTLVGATGDCDLADGFGTQARLLEPSGLVFDGVNLIARDECSLRKVTPTGLVSTWVGDGICDSVRRDGVGSQASVLGTNNGGSSMSRAADGKIWFVDVDSEDATDAGTWLREVTPNGEVFTRARLQLQTLQPEGSASFGSFAALPNGHFAVAEDTLPNDGGSGVSIIVDASPNGATQLTNLPSTQNLTAVPGGFIGVTYEAVILYAPDGGYTYLAASRQSGFADGPLDAGRFIWPVGPALAPDGSVAFFDLVNENVRLIHDGQLTTLAGPRPDRRLVDGPGSTARLQQEETLVVSPSGDAYFSDTHEIRKLDTTGAVSTVVGSDAGTDFGPAIDGPFGSAALTPYRLSLTSQGDLLFTDSHWVAALSDERQSIRLASLSTATVSTLVDDLYFLLDASAEKGGGFAWILATPQDNVLFIQPPVGPMSSHSMPQTEEVYADATGGFITHSYNDLMHVDLMGNSTTVLPDVCPQYCGRVAFDALGNVYVLDGPTNLVFRVDPSGVRTTVLDLADHADDLAVEPQGTVLFLVPSALLRFHP